MTDPETLPLETVHEILDFLTSPPEEAIALSEVNREFAEVIRNYLKIQSERKLKRGEFIDLRRFVLFRSRNWKLLTSLPEKTVEEIVRQSRPTPELMHLFVYRELASDSRFKAFVAPRSTSPDEIAFGDANERVVFHPKNEFYLHERTAPRTKLEALLYVGCFADARSFADWRDPEALYVIPKATFRSVAPPRERESKGLLFVVGECILKGLVFAPDGRVSVTASGVKLEFRARGSWVFANANVKTFLPKNFLFLRDDLPLEKLEEIALVRKQSVSERAKGKLEIW